MPGHKGPAFFPGQGIKLPNERAHSRPRPPDGPWYIATCRSKAPVGSNRPVGAVKAEGRRTTRVLEHGRARHVHEPRCRFEVTTARSGVRYLVGRNVEDVVARQEEAHPVV